MAKIGLKGFWVGTFSETTEGITYTNGKKIAKAVSLNEGKTISEQKLYADNALADSVFAVTDMSVELTPDGIDDTDLSQLIGLAEQKVTINGEEQTVTVTTANDEGAAVGVGYIVQERTGGVTSHRAKIFAKVKFKPSESVDNTTKGESINFVTPSYKGTCYATDNGYYIFEDTFTDESKAEAWIESILAVSSL